MPRETIFKGLASTSTDYPSSQSSASTYRVFISNIQPSRRSRLGLGRMFLNSNNMRSSVESSLCHSINSNSMSTTAQIQAAPSNRVPKIEQDHRSWVRSNKIVRHCRIFQALIMVHKLSISLTDARETIQSLYALNDIRLKRDAVPQFLEQCNELFKAFELKNADKKRERGQLTFFLATIPVADRKNRWVEQLKKVCASNYTGTLDSMEIISQLLRVKSTSRALLVKQLAVLCVNVPGIELKARLLEIIGKIPSEKRQSFVNQSNAFVEFLGVHRGDHTLQIISCLHRMKDPERIQFIGQCQKVVRTLPHMNIDDNIEVVTLLQKIGPAEIDAFIEGYACLYAHCSHSVGRQEQGLRLSIIRALASLPACERIHFPKEVKSALLAGEVASYNLGRFIEDFAKTPRDMRQHTIKISSQRIQNVNCMLMPLASGTKYPIYIHNKP